MEDQVMRLIDILEQVSPEMFSYLVHGVIVSSIASMAGGMVLCIASLITGSTLIRKIEYSENRMVAGTMMAALVVAGIALFIMGVVNALAPEAEVLRNLMNAVR